VWFLAEKLLLVMIRILLVDDRPFTRQILTEILKTESNFSIVGEAENGLKALEIIKTIEVDIAIVDLDMPKMDGFELTEQICKNFSDIKVIILSSHEDKYSINKAVNCGARGYLLKNTSTNEIIDTINYVERGYFQLGPGLFEKLIAKLSISEAETFDRLSKLENNYDRYFKLIKKAIILQKQQIHQEITEEVNLEIDNLKFELKQGLNNFQSQVNQQIQNGLNDFGENYYDPKVKDRYSQELYVKFTQTILLMESKYNLSFNELNKKIVALRYCIIILIIMFLIEHIVMLFVK
jgi:DNA-binding NarL/FixJ family response regulator